MIRILPPQVWSYASPLSLTANLSLYIYYLHSSGGALHLFLYLLIYMFTYPTPTGLERRFASFFHYERIRSPILPRVEGLTRTYTYIYNVCLYLHYIRRSGLTLDLNPTLPSQVWRRSWVNAFFKLLTCTYNVYLYL